MDTQLLKSQEYQAIPTGEYLAVPLDHLRTEGIINSRLFLKVGRDKFVKYSEAGLVFNETVRQRLNDNRHTHLYARNDDSDGLNVYMEANLKAALNDPELPEDKKAEILYTTSTHIVRVLLNNPQSSEAIKGARNVVENATSYILKDAGSLGHVVEISSFDYYTYTHSTNVMSYAVALGASLGYNKEKNLIDLGLSALLHDIGKKYVRKKVTNKRGRLTKAEFNEIMRHPDFGFNALKKSEQLASNILDVVRSHHEKIDGTGYPQGLRGSEISLDARIVSCTDIYDALTTRRVYRKAYRIYPALRLMKEMTGSKIDAEVYQEFVKLLGEL